MPDTSIVVALAGGAGAVAGAAVSQLVQWWREHSHASIEERHRAEDRQEALDRELRISQRETYLDIVNRCVDLRIYFSRFMQSLDTDEGKSPSGLRQMWSAFADTATDKSREIYRLATTHGSDSVRLAAEGVHFEHYELWQYFIQVVSVSDADLLEFQRLQLLSHVSYINEKVNNIIEKIRHEMMLA
jgi:hypothetical protein